MVSNVTSLTGNGLKDWLIQRVTALYFAVYAVFIFGYIFLHPNLSYGQWLNLFHCPWFRVASVIAFITFTLHAWIGIWTVTTDYLKCTVIRLSVQLFVALFLTGQFIWALMIIWGQ